MNQITNSTEVRKLRRIVEKVNSLAEEMKALSNEALRAKTDEFKARLSAGETLDDLLPEAFAVCREASGRVLGMFPYDVQVMGGIVLHQGRIAEMKTGEGKTLVAALPLYLNALTGKGCILVTTNSYLAVRDGQQMSQLYKWLGLSTAIGVKEDDVERFTEAQKKGIYAADIVYTTNATLGFDYLLENLISSPEKRYLRPFNYCIIDEADSVLLDSAIKPLIISGAPREQSGLFHMADYLICSMEEHVDYEQEDKEVWFTDAGIEHAKRYLEKENLFTLENFELVQNISLALRAHVLFKKEKDYVVEDNSIQLLDQQTGRIMPSVRLRIGQHQALEAKEGLPQSEDKRSMASITYQDLFNMFPKKGGMTGTGLKDAPEFRENYQMDVVVIPTRKKLQRVDYPDLYFTNHEAQVGAAMDELMRLHSIGQPVLVITGSIAMSDVFSDVLLHRGIPHNVLNAYHIAKEAGIIKEAGQMNAVTVATSVAGRGTDIRLGEGVRELGGLAVLGIGRMENMRLELQARGRAGRQGDPGFSRFYISLEDQVVQDYGPTRLQKLTTREAQIKNERLKRAVLKAQQICEDHGREGRRYTTEFGKSMLMQRTIVYETRQRIMDHCPTDPQYYLDIERQNIDDFLLQKGDALTTADLRRYLMDHILYGKLDTIPESAAADEDAAEAFLMRYAKEALQNVMDGLSDEWALQQYFREKTLQAVDTAWIDQVDYLQQLRIALQGRQYAQRNVLYEYHQEASRSYLRMKERIRIDMMKNILQG